MLDPINNGRDSFAFKDDEEKEECLPQIQELKIKLQIRIYVLALIAMVVIGLLTLLF